MRRNLLLLAVVVSVVFAGYVANSSGSSSAWLVVMLLGAFGGLCVHAFSSRQHQSRLLALAEEGRNTLLESIQVTPNPFAIYDRHDMLIAWNNSYEALHEGVFETLKQPVHYADLVRAIARKTLPAEQIEEHVATRVADQRRGAGEWNDRMSANGIWYRVTKMRTASDAVVGIAIDITELKRREQDIATQHEIIADISKRIAQGTNDESSSLSEVSATIDEMVETLQAMDAQTQGVHEASVESSGEARRASSALGDTAKAMVNIEGVTQQMQSVNGLVEEISRQIRVLALNASIEANKAGEQGSGFNVVASEVRTLAERSAQAADDVRRLIETNTTQVRDATHVTSDAVTTLASAVERIEWMDEQVKQSLERMTRQSRNIEAVARSVAAVSAASANNARASEELVERTRVFDADSA